MLSSDKRWYIEVSPKYMQLADLLRGEIAKIVKEGNSRLPTEKEISISYDVSRQTVRNALEMLENEGLIARKQGSGSYVKEIKKERTDAKQIAVVTTFIDDYIFPSILHDAQSIFETNGYTTIVYATENKVEREREILLSLREKNVSAILIEGSKTALPTPNTDIFAKLKEMEIPVLFLHGAYHNLPDFPCILDDNYAGGYMLAKYLIGKGHTKIAGIFKSDDMQGPERYHGVVSAMVDSGLIINDSSFCWYDSEDRKAIINGQGADRIDRFINKRLSGSTAVVCYNDEIAYTLIKRMIEFGKKVPEDISVVSFDNSFYSQIGAVPITSLGHKNQKTGKTAAEILVSMLSKGKYEQSVKLKWDLTARASG